MYQTNPRTELLLKVTTNRNTMENKDRINIRKNSPRANKNQDKPSDLEQTPAGSHASTQNNFQDNSIKETLKKMPFTVNAHPKKRVLITGAAGFLGSHLVDRFLAAGFQVIGMDNFSTGSVKNISRLKDNKNFRFIHWDVTTPFSFKGQLDYILHFACPASPIDYNRLPIETLKSGSMAAFNLLELAKNHHARILFASTSEIYGDPLESPQKEQYWGHVNPIGPRSVYDESKRFQESLTMTYHQCYQVETRIVRIFNTYGPRMRLNDGRVLPALAAQALLGKDLQVFGNGMQTRCFCYVSDLVEGVFRALHSDCSSPINLGSTQEMTILDFARLILKLTGSDSKICFSSLPEDDPRKRCPDTSKARQLLDWRPVTALEEGLRKTLAYFRTELSSMSLQPVVDLKQNGLLIPQKSENAMVRRLVSGS